jgi:drug/metabolite transporter (DMT)-like permease
MTPATWISLVLLAAIWGGSFLFGRIAAQELPALVISLARVALAAAALWTFCLVSRRPIPPLSRELMAGLAVMGLLNNAIPFSLILWGQREIGAGLASILNAMTPLFTLVVAQLATADEKMTVPKVIGIGTGIAGVVVLVGDDVWKGASGNVMAELAVLGAAFSYGLSGVWGRRFRGIDPVFVATGQLTASSLILCAVAFPAVSLSTLAMPSMPALLSILALALLCTAVAYVLFFRILAAAGATNTSLVTFLVPVSAILLGAIILGERLSAREIGGMALIACALVLVDGRATRMSKVRQDKD